MAKAFSQYKDTPRYVTALARGNRGESTSQEEKLWIRLSGKKLEGHKFRRQFPIGRYVADFYNHPNRLVIEIDGKIHENQQGYDANRDSWIAASGYTIVRFTNEEIEKNMEAVLVKIKNLLNSPPAGDIGGVRRKRFPPAGDIGGVTRKAIPSARAVGGVT